MLVSRASGIVALVEILATVRDLYARVHLRSALKKCCFRNCHLRHLHSRINVQESISRGVERQFAAPGSSRKQSRRQRTTAGGIRGFQRGHSTEASRGVEGQFAAAGSSRRQAGRRPEAGRRQAGGRPEAGRKQAGSRPEAGRTQAGSRAGGSWIGLLQNRNPHRCAMEGGVKDPMGRHDVR